MGAALALLAACGMDASDTQLPAKWAIDYENKSIGQIIDALGAPQEDGNAQQFLNWVERRKTGTLVLKVSCPGKCEADEMPSAVVFSVFPVGEFKPLKVTSLLKAQPDAARAAASAALPASDPSHPR